MGYDKFASLIGIQYEGAAAAFRYISGKISGKSINIHSLYKPN